MFILVPLSIFIASTAIVVFICYRKLGYLKKLSTEQSIIIVAEDISAVQFLQQMFPEIFDYFRRVDVAAHKSSLLLEFEKFLRRSRVTFMKVDNLSNTLIHKIRATHIQELQKSQEKQEVQKVEKAIADEPAVFLNKSAELKQREHDLIVAIAKDPKNPKLYKNLGDLYIETQQWSYANESFASALKLDPAIKGVKRKLELSGKMLGLRGH